MKTIKILFFLMLPVAMLPVAFTGCNGEKAKKDVAVNLRAYVNPSELKLSEYDFKDRVGLFMKRSGEALTASGAVCSNANNVEMTVGSSGLLSSAEEILYPKANVDFIAYYPYVSDVGADFTVAVNVRDQTGGLPEVIYSNGKTNIEPTTSVVALYFRYVLAKVELTVSSEKGSSPLGYGEYDAMQATVAGLNTKALLQLATGTFSDVTIPAVILPYKEGSDDVSACFSFLSLPANGQVTFMFIHGSEVYSTPPVTVNWEGARLYRYSIKLDASTPNAPEVIVVDAGSEGREDAGPVKEITVDID